MFMFLALTVLTACGSGPGSADTEGVLSRSGSGRAVLTVSNIESGERVPEDLFGINISASVESSWACPFENTAVTAYQEKFRAMSLPAVRVNMGGTLMGEIFASQASAPNWGCLDILLRNLGGMHNGKLMVSLASVPEWVDISTDEGRKRYAALAQSVMERFRAFGLNPDSWEVINEPEVLGPSKFDDVCLLFNETAGWLRANDPSARIGGPVLAWPNEKLVERFFELSGGKADFISYHEYGTTDLSLPTYDVMDRTYLFRDYALRIGGLIGKYKGSQGIALTEYHLNASWQPHTDARQADAEGAVFAALALMNAAEGGVDSAYLWEAFNDGTFGAIDGNYNLRPTGRALSILARSFPGNMVRSDISTDSGWMPTVKAMATKVIGGGYTAVIVNYGDTSVPLSVNLPADWGERVFVHEISRAVPGGAVHERAKAGDGMEIESPAMSLLILSAEQGSF